MNVANVDVRDLSSRARWSKSSCRNGDHFMLLIGKHLPRPSPNAAADKNKACHADAYTRYQAREAKRDSEGEEDRPRCASRHLDGLS